MPSDPIEREPERPQLGLGQIGNSDCRHLGESQLPCCQHEPPARNDALLGVDQDRQDEAEPIEARRELAHLFRRGLRRLPPHAPPPPDTAKPLVQINPDPTPTPPPPPHPLPPPPPLPTPRRL